eukprot:gene30204-35187_t
MNVPNLQLAHVKSNMQIQCENVQIQATVAHMRIATTLNLAASFPRRTFGTATAAAPNLERPVTVDSLPTLDRLADDLRSSRGMVDSDGAAADSAIQEAGSMLNAEALPHMLGQMLLEQGGSEEGREEQEQRVSRRRRRGSRGGGADDEEGEGGELQAQGGVEEKGRGVQHPKGPGVKRRFVKESSGSRRLPVNLEEMESFRLRFKAN